MNVESQFTAAMNLVGCTACGGRETWSSSRTGDGYLWLRCERCRAEVIYSPAGFSRTETSMRTRCPQCGSNDLEVIEGYAVRCRACGKSA